MFRNIHSEQKRERPISNTTRLKLTGVHQTSLDFSEVHWNSTEFLEIALSSINSIDFDRIFYKYSLTTEFIQFMQFTTSARVAVVVGCHGDGRRGAHL